MFGPSPSGYRTPSPFVNLTHFDTGVCPDAKRVAPRSPSPHNVCTDKARGIGVTTVGIDQSQSQMLGEGAIPLSVHSSLGIRCQCCVKYEQRIEVKGQESFRLKQTLWPLTTATVCSTRIRKFNVRAGPSASMGTWDIDILRGCKQATKGSRRWP